MIKEALHYIVGLGNTRVETIEGQIYSTQKMNLVEQSTPKSIVVNSLSGLVEYLNSQFDGKQQLMVHVESPTAVQVFSHLNRDTARNYFIRAEALLPSFRFGSWIESEQFNIALQSVFVTNEDRGKILQVVGNIKDENVTSFGDDGVSQQVQAKTGIATVANVTVPNPVNLRPFRTFTEIEQPESAFVFRLKKGPETPLCALFEADGGAWKVEAMDKVRAYLEEELRGEINDKHIVLIA